MDKKEQLSLIEGRFTVNEANEILTNIFTTKIDFHVAKNFNNHLRFGTDNEISKNRIPLLRKSLTQLKQLLHHAEKLGMDLEVTSEINVKLVNKNEL